MGQCKVVSLPLSAKVVSKCSYISTDVFPVFKSVIKTNVYYLAFTLVVIVKKKIAVVLYIFVLLCLIQYVYVVYFVVVVFFCTALAFLNVL